MKIALAILFALVALVVAQPVDEAKPGADELVKKFIESDSEDLPDLEGSEFILKLIEKKIAKLTKKCYKLGGCHDYGYEGGYGVPYGGYASYPVPHYGFGGYY